MGAVWLRAACVMSMAVYVGAAGGCGGGDSEGQGGGGGTTSTSTVNHAVINEISAKGDDWVEIANPTAAALDISGFGLCDDVDPATGSACDLATIVRFPEGTTIPAGGALLVLGNQDTSAGSGPYAACLPSGSPATCYYASWKVSSSNGETVHLVGADDAVVDEARYPVDAAASGQTWGRLPDKTGGFAIGAPTPGTPNQAL